MAIDVYLQIEGIKGESTDSVHNDWIECSSVNWAISQPKSATASTGGGHTAERCEHSDVTFRAPVAQRNQSAATLLLGILQRKYPCAVAPAKGK